MSHPAEEKLHAYLGNQLSPEERAQYEAHLANCAECREQCASQSELNELLTAWQAPKISPGFDEQLQSRLPAARPRSTWSHWGWLAAAAIVLLALFLNWQRSPAGDPLPIERVEETLADLEALSVLNPEGDESL